ncbi:unnamed protein product [Peronospora farinosa]|uniref:Uncharacterized protein n=1 Tax=Peronospora farinosa TaxID=134698 RepID=A0AAV0SZZ9_9STRA|nr:unnamed protein product [Peronospora farinosa]CAI5709670.1 unnamed protein product [Peronospora farinosa]
MKVFTGLLVVALAVTSSYAEKSKNLRASAIEEDDTAIEDSQDSEISEEELIVNAADFTGSGGKLNIMDVIGEEKGKVPMMSIFKAYFSSSIKDVEDDDSAENHKKHPKQNAKLDDDEDDDDDNKTKSKIDDVNLTDDNPTKDNKAADSGNNEFSWKSSKSSKNKGDLDDNDLEDSNELDDTNGQVNTKVGGIGETSLGGGKDVNVKGSSPIDDSNDLFNGTNVKKGKSDLLGEGTGGGLQGSDLFKSDKKVKDPLSDENQKEAIGTNFKGGQVDTKVGGTGETSLGGGKDVNVKESFLEDDPDDSNVKEGKSDSNESNGLNSKGKKFMSDEENVNQDMLQVENEDDDDDDDTKPLKKTAP